jgi:hypothetical protein
LPDNLREEALKMLIEYRDRKMPWNVHDLTKNSVNGIIGLLQQPRAEDWQEQLERLQVYTKSLDSARNQSYTVLDSRIVDFIDGKV